MGKELLSVFAGAAQGRGFSHVLQYLPAHDDGQNQPHECSNQQRSHIPYQYNNSFDSEWSETITALVELLPHADVLVDEVDDLR
jgi:hypothetical protein